jgi:signal transduction histidine kinase
VTHELKGPLTTIRGFGQIMRRQAEYNERGVDAILSQTAQLERLIDDMLDAVRVEAGRLDLQRVDTDLNALVSACAEQAQARTQQHRILAEIPATPIHGWWDPDRLTQILGNLLSNAIKYDPHGGEVRVIVTDAGDSARISVQDAGIGIPLEAQARLFERFYRAGDSSASVKGLGLGLYITRSLVEAHGGTIEVDSTPNAGSTFTVILPRQANALLANP